VDVAARFGQNLSRCRRAAGLTQEELGRLASVHRTEVGLLERGLRIARVDTLVKLCSALSVSSEDLLEGIDWAPGDSSRGEFSVTEPDG
jgi:transcriptional regulator with XRE-family HTH domain